MVSARLVMIVMAALAAMALPAAAQEPQRVVPVAVRVIPPMVEQTNGQLSGFSIDLWNAIDCAATGPRTTVCA